MKRSKINQELVNTIAFFRKMNFALPGWAFWSPDDWKGKREEAAEIIDCGLGWDITDFGSNDFENVGLINFNLRNGIVNQTAKPYCEKIIVVKENQITPLHTHNDKMEDIINRGGGNLVIQLYGSDRNLELTEDPVTVYIDGFAQTVPAGGTVVLKPGESIFLVPGVFHEFWGEEGSGLVLVGEVSTVNDDNIDNIFVGGNPRFPNIEEDEPPLHLLVNDYEHYV
jgi:D-lyxose ketol-isomerase